MRQVKIFGKKDCGACQATKSKLSFFIAKWALDDVELIYYDLDTSDGLTEAAMAGALERPPTTIIQEDSKVLLRIDGRIPESKEFEKFLQNR